MGYEDEQDVSFSFYEDDDEEELEIGGDDVVASGGTVARDGIELGGGTMAREEVEIGGGTVARGGTAAGEITPPGGSTQAGNVAPKPPSNLVAAAKPIAKPETKKEGEPPQTSSLFPSPNAAGAAPLYSMMEQLANEGGWSIDSADQVSWTPHLATILGFEPDKGNFGRDNFINCAHPTDQAALGAAITKAFDEKKGFTLRHKIMRSDLSVRFVETTGAYADQNGEEVVAGYMRDITDQSEDDKLELAASVFSETFEGMVMTNQQGVIEFVNPAFTKITGFSAEEATGAKMNIVKSDHHDADFYKDMWRSLITRGTWRGEIWNRHKGGEAYLALLSITAVKSAQGKTTHYIGVLFDKSEMTKGDDEALFASHRDPLTGLPNRVLYFDRLTHALRHAGRRSEKVAVVSLAIDNLDEINQAQGHTAGDMTLGHLAEIVGGVLREEDTLARFGPSEFVLLVERWEEEWGEKVVLARIREKLAEPFPLPQEEATLAASIGVAIYPNDGDDPAALIEKAMEKRGSA